MIPLVERQLAAVRDVCRRLNVRRLDLFGSAVSGDFDAATSDLDFVVSLEESSPAEYTESYFALAHELERLFGRRVDLVTERSVRNPYFRQVIESTRQPLYAG